jgi:hypothetical protein
MPFVTIYVDNLIVASDSLEEHEEHIQKFIDRCTQLNILLDPKKSTKIAFTQIKTLGNVLTTSGVAPTLTRSRLFVTGPNQKQTKNWCNSYLLLITCAVM